MYLLQMYDVIIRFGHNGRIYTLPRRAHLIDPGSFPTVVTEFLNQYYPTLETTDRYLVGNKNGLVGMTWTDKEEIVPNQEDKNGTLLHGNSLRLEMYSVTIEFKHNGRIYSLPRRAHVIDPRSFPTVVTQFLNQYYPTWETTRNYSLVSNYGHAAVISGDKEEIVPNQEDKNGTLLHGNSLRLEIYSVRIEFPYGGNNTLLLIRDAYVTDKINIPRVVTDFLNLYYPACEEPRVFSYNINYLKGIDISGYEEKIVPNQAIENRTLLHKNYQM